MLHHIILIKWIDGVSDAHKELAQRELKQFASTLAGVVSYDCGPNAGFSEGASDFAVSAVFENEAAWRVYDEADEHNRIRREIFGPNVSERKVIQFFS